MSIISANSLFHFTRTYNTLISILENGFFPKYSLENFEIFGVNKLDAEIAFPMVCYCDLPLSQTKNHLDTYGYFGLGLTKEWGLKNGLSPVAYVSPNSINVKTIRAINDFIWELRRNKVSPKNWFHDDEYIEISRAISFFLKYTKPLYGKLYRTGKYRKNIHFYNEREWRYVPYISRNVGIHPDFLGHHFKLLKKGAFPIDKDLIEVSEKKLENTNAILFKPSDLKYIIVRDENSFKKLREYLTHSQKFKINQKEWNTKLLTAKNIFEDF